MTPDRESLPKPLEPGADMSVARAFEAVVRRRERHLAVRDGENGASFGDLNAWSNQIAHAVLDRLSDASAPARVGLLLEHNIGGVAALLGVLKAGHVAVMLDPLDPPARLRDLLRDAEPSLIVSATPEWGTLDRLGVPGIRAFAVEDAAREPTTNLDRASADDAALIVYTSGSTGRPKGVVRGHRMLIDNSAGSIARFDVTAGDRFANLARLTAGQGSSAVFRALLSGASLHLRALKLEGLADLPEWIDREGITIYQSSATVFRSLVRLVEPARRFPTVRVVRLGSERVLQSDVDAKQRFFRDDCLFANVLSMTECGAVAINVVDGPMPADDVFVPVGQAVPNKEVTVVDADGRSCPDGEVGEIVVKSHYLSLGYWRDPELTRQKFDIEADGRRVFRTGDRGLVRDGRLLFAGRTDRRVKVRGYRVELDEVEACLRLHPDVRAAAVVQESADADTPRLVAYVTMAGTRAVSATELRAHVLTRLPDQMAPSLIEVLDELPLTAGGKVDRVRLAARAIERRTVSAPRVEARTPVEAQLVAIWTEVLGIPGLGIHDDFFVSGGDSLRASQILARVRATFGRQIAFRAFLQHATVSGLATLIDGMPAGDHSYEPVLRRWSVAGPAPLSFAQEQIWLAERTRHQGPAYNEVRAVRLRGRLDRAAVRRAFDLLVERHGALRTVFDLTDSGPVQRIVEPAPRADFAERDLAAHGDREGALIRDFEQEAGRAFDLTTDVLLRGRLVCLGPDDHALLVVKHHIASDARSGDILLGELADFYREVATGQPARLPELAIAYQDFAAWQRQRLSNAELDRELAHLVRTLDGAPTILDVFAVGRPESTSGAAGRVSLTIPGSVGKGLDARAHEARATLFMVLLAGFELLIHRYTGLGDFLVGSPMSGRLRRETERLVGCFANLAVFRARIGADDTMASLIARVRDAAVDVYDHQHVPFGRLVEAIRPERQPNRSPLVQVVLGLHDGSQRLPSFEGTASSAIPVAVHSAKFDLTVSLGRSGEALSGYVEYDTRRFSADQIERLASHFERVLAAIAADAEQRVSDVSLLTPGERHMMLVGWNPPAPPVSARSLAEQFAAQAGETPNHVAVRADDGVLTYAELSARVAAVASVLKQGGVGPGVAVGVCLERSAALIVATLAVVAAGGAYVPIEPAMPGERLSQMLGTAVARLIVADASFDATVSAAINRTIRLAPGGLLAEAPGGAGPAPEAPDATPGSADDTAYVMFTSGSTGRPKGVVVPQRAITRLVKETNYITIGPQDVVAQASNAAFDAFTFELWGALLNGAELLVIPRETVLTPADLGAVLTAHAVTVMFCPTALFAAIGREAPEALRGVRDLLVGGDVMDVAAARRVMAVRSSGRLVNMYGPTECTTFATWHDITDDDLSGAVPIGRPITNTQAYELDSRLAPVPIEVVGELCLGGVGLAAGYAGDPALTTERFVPHPGRPGHRLFRTGDRVSWRADGVLRFHGRIDDQVKVRGFLVAPAEVEATIARHPSVGQAVVVARANDSGEKELIAYVVPKGGSQVAGADIMAFVAERQPDYLVPKTVVILDAMPLTTNGKVDRVALPTPAAASGCAPVEPLDELEARIVAVWRAVLGVSHVSRTDDFFRLGGHSLLAVQVVARLSRELGCTVPAHILFSHPTVARLAERVREIGASDVGPPVVPRPESLDVLPASDLQQEVWARRSASMPASGFMVVRAFDLEGWIDRSALEDALTAMVRRHEILRTGLEPHGRTLMQRVSAPYVVALEYVDLSADPAPDAAADARFAEEVRRPYLLATGPWVRAVLLHLGDRRSRLLLGLPHEVYDGVALDLFFREIESFYAARVGVAARALSCRPLQYADYVWWQRTHRAQAQDDLDYWVRTLTGVGEPRLPVQRWNLTRRLSLQATRLRSLPFVGRAASGGWLRRAGGLVRGLTALKDSAPELGRCDVAASVAVADALRAMARAEGVTLYAVLLAAFSSLIADRTGQPDVVVAISAANRDRPELQEIIGYLADTRVLRTMVDEGESFRALVRRVAGVVTAAQLHGRASFRDVSRATTRVGERPLEYRIPLQFQLVESLETVPRLHGVTVTRATTNSRHRSVRIVVTLATNGRGITGAFRWDPRLYDSAGCVALARSFEAVLAAAVESPDEPVRAIVSRVPGT